MIEKVKELLSSLCIEDRILGLRIADSEGIIDELFYPIPEDYEWVIGKALYESWINDLPELEKEQGGLVIINETGYYICHNKFIAKVRSSQLEEFKNEIIFTNNTIEI